MDAVVGEEDAQWTEPGVPELTVLVHNVLVSAAISFYQLLYTYTINEKKPSNSVYSSSHLTSFFEKLPQTIILPLYRKCEGMMGALQPFLPYRNALIILQHGKSRLQYIQAN